MLKDIINISSELLYKKLETISCVITSKPLTPILGDFLFDFQRYSLTIYASDYQTTIFTKIAVDCNFIYKIAVPADIIIATLKNLPNQNITFAIDDETNTIVFKSNNGAYTIGGEECKAFPIIQLSDIQSHLEFNTKELKEKLERVITVASNDTLTPILNSVYFDFKQTEEKVLVATDIHRLIKIKVSQIRIEKPLSFVLAKRTIMLLIKILCDDKIIKADFDNKYIRITMNDIVFISTFILDKQYPDYETAIPKNNKNILIVNRESLLWTLKRLILFTNALTYQITLSISEKELKIMADDVNFAHKAEETLPCTYDGENGIMILYNVKYLLDILQNLNSENVIMKLAPIGDNKYSQKASIIMPEKNDEQIILLMPMRP